jgi:hypothetical protein
MALSVTLMILFFMYLFESVGDFDFIAIIFILIVTFYSMTIFPGAGLLFHTSVIPVAILYLIWFIKFFDFSFLEIRIRPASLFGLLFVLTFFTLFLSIVIFNFKDLLKPLGISKAIAYIGSVFLFGYCIAKWINYDHRVFLKIVRGLVYSGLISSLIGIVTIFANINPTATIPNTAISFWSHVNLPTFLYVFTVPCALYIIYFEKRTITYSQRVFVYFALLVMVINVFFTFNRSGIIAMIAGIIIMTFFYSRKLFFSLILFIIPLASFILSLLVSKGTGTVLSRLQLYFVALEMMRSSFSGFLFGFGMETNFQIFERIKNSNMIYDSHNYPHNSYVFFILSFGFIPLVFMLMTLFGLLFKGIKSAFLFKNKDVSIYLPITIFISVMIYALFEDFFLFTDNFMYYLVLLFLGHLYFKVFKNGSKHLIIK